MGNPILNMPFCGFFCCLALFLKKAEYQHMIKLMIVDDHVYVRQAWSQVLGQVPLMEVIAQCANGKEAIEAADRLQPDVILMDINMAPVNGIEATRSIRDSGSVIKIIGVSVQAERSYVSEMLRNGANGFVTKNSSSTEMINAIHAVMAGSTYLCEEVGHLRDQIDNIGKIN
jgi:two-component system, NarL family, invasion response regulator UvrY